MTSLPGSAIADTNIPLEPTVMVSEMTIAGPHTFIFKTLVAADINFQRVSI